MSHEKARVACPCLREVLRDWEILRMLKVRLVYWRLLWWESESFDLSVRWFYEAKIRAVTLSFCFINIIKVDVERCFDVELDL